VPEFPKKEDILAFVKESTKPVTKREISRAFQIKNQSRVALKAVLKQMVAEGQIEKTRGKSYIPPEGLPDVITVKITGINEKNDWIAEPEKWHGNGKPPRILVKPAKDDDPVGTTALVRLQRVNEREYTAKIIKHFSQHAHGAHMVGTVHVTDGVPLFFPAERGNPAPIPVPKQYADQVKDRDLIAAYIVPGRDLKLIEVLGQEDDPKLLSLIAIYQEGIPHIFPDNVLKETDDMRVPEDEKGREDLKNTPLVTIDGADAKDFDDAVFAEPDTDPKNKGGWHIIVAIADVSWYVREGTALNEHALERGNSTYFPDRVVPMLPEKLSNDLCSLRPHEPRACFAVHLWIDAHGELINFKFVRAIMQSHARLTYEQVQAAKDGHADKTAAPLMDNVIAPLYKVFKVLEHAREKRGALEIDLPEFQAQINDDGNITGIARRERMDSHKLIEEFMILANIAAAKAIEESDLTGIYRIHPPPDAAKLSATNDFLKSLGQNAGKTLQATPKDINNILTRVKNTKFNNLINIIVLRSQSQAIYYTENKGHFGLSLTHYTHFTSPIRRFADLLVHRALVRIYNLGPGGLSDDDMSQISEMAEHISTTERRSMLAERKSNDRYAALYLKDRVNAEFQGTINGMSKAGLFITLTETGSDGFIPSRMLPRDYYIHDEKRHALVGQKTKRVFQLCAPVIVELLEIDVLSGSIIFGLRMYDGQKMPAPSPHNHGQKPNRRHRRNKRHQHVRKAAQKERAHDHKGRKKNKKKKKKF